MKRSLAILTTTLVMSAVLHPAAAEDSYKFELKLTTKDARHDPDGVWSADSLALIRLTHKAANIYTARVNTPSGSWLLSQTNGDCNLQGMCTALLVLTKTGAPPREMANPQMPLGGTALMSLNYKMLKTSEITESGQPITGSYKVGPLP
ncbi:hypothetical protein [Ensifer sp. SL37]|uniref:hypothetical protein n=1 Tax=Ensifer sp. SL37 TaxID=2995137 RepID=UPI00227548D9|nr:hypothetical protein [Ensifer sp. SL37]MCY1740694.1 hypothetical protein [Ensifer sp. SL37]